MKKVRIWFNHWFSTAYHIINLIKDDKEIDFHVVGTSENPDSAVGLACDEWYAEPHIDGDDDYVDFCLDFCRKHDIEIFIPRRKMTAVVKRAADFSDKGILILADCDYEKLMRLSDKESTYKLFGEFAPRIIPERYVIHSAAEFEAAYKKITANGCRACMKLAHDEGAVSFRVIDDRMSGYNGLFVQPGMKISYKQAVSALSEHEILPHAFIVMPYLDGREVSADCLHTEQGNIIVPRFKTNTRAEEIRFDNEIISLCQQFMERTHIETPCNVQFRYHNDKPYLLEVNTRMSGGIQLSCIGAGVNIPNIAVNRLLGINKEWNLCRSSRKVTYIETPMIMQSEKTSEIL